MSQALPAPEPLTLLVIVPDTRKKVGALTLDVFKIATGKSIADHLGRFLREPPVVAENEQTGAFELHYIVDIQAGSGVSLPIPSLGEFGLAHTGHGVLSLTCPQVLAGVFDELLANTSIRTSEPQALEHNGTTLTQFFVRTRPDLSIGFPVPKLGQVRIVRLT